MKNIYLVLIVACFVSVLGPESEAEPLEINLSVVTISPLIPQNGALQEAVVGLRFFNSGVNKASIPTFAVTGKGGGTLNFVRGTPCFNLQLDGKKQPAVGGYATVKYQWLNEKGAVVLSDFCSLTSGELDLIPGGSELLRFPIRIPQEKGVYDIVLTFNNRILSMLLQSSNTFLIGSHVNGAPVFFEGTTRAKVEIGDQK